MRRSVLPALSLALALSGCGFSDSSDEDANGTGATPPSTSSPATGSGTAAEVALNERGNVPLEIGEEAGIRPSATQDGPPALSLALDEVVVDSPCADAEDSDFTPANGHFVALRLRVTTTTEYDARVLTSFNDYDFQVVGPDGRDVGSTFSDDARGCFDPTRMLHHMRIGPGQEYVGWMVLDLPVTSGAVVYAPAGASNGWEWQF